MEPHVLYEFTTLIPKKTITFRKATFSFQIKIRLIQKKKNYIPEELQNMNVENQLQQTVDWLMYIQILDL